jgi:hypothetical protein
MSVAIASPVSETRAAPAEGQRVVFLIRHFRMWYAVVEREVLASLWRLTGCDHGGGWRGHDLANGGCFLAPEHGTFRVQTPNGPAEVGAETAGMIATLRALQSLSEQHPTKQLFATRVRELREFACRHPDAATVFAAVDRSGPSPRDREARSVSADRESTEGGRRDESEEAVRGELGQRLDQGS